MPRGKISRGKHSRKPLSDVKLQRRMKQKLLKKSRSWEREWKYDQQEFPQIIQPKMNKQIAFSQLKEKEEEVTSMVIYEPELRKAKFLNFSFADCDILSCNILQFLPLFDKPGSVRRELYSELCCDYCTGRISEYETCGLDIDLKTLEHQGIPLLKKSHKDRLDEATMKRHRTPLKDLPLVDMFIACYEGSYALCGPDYAYVAVAGDKLVFIAANNDYGFGDEDTKLEATVCYAPLTSENLNKILVPDFGGDFFLAYVKTAEDICRTLLRLEGNEKIKKIDQQFEVERKKVFKIKHVKRVPVPISLQSFGLKNLSTENYCAPAADESVAT